MFLRLGRGYKMMSEIGEQKTYFLKIFTKKHADFHWFLRQIRNQTYWHHWTNLWHHFHNLSMYWMNWFILHGNIFVMMFICRILGQISFLTLSSPSYTYIFRSIIFISLYKFGPVEITLYIQYLGYVMVYGRSEYITIMSCTIMVRVCSCMSMLGALEKWLCR